MSETRTLREWLEAEHAAATRTMALPDVAGSGLLAMGMQHAYAATLRKLAERSEPAAASVPQEFTAEQVQRHIDRLVPFTAEASGYDNPIISEQVAMLRAYARALSSAPGGRT
jgi:hypothetical protein